MKTYPADPVEAMRMCWSEPIAPGAYHFDDVAKHGKPAKTPAPQPEDPEDLI